MGAEQSTVVGSRSDSVNMLPDPVVPWRGRALTDDWNKCSLAKSSTAARVIIEEKLVIFELSYWFIIQVSYSSKDCLKSRLLHCGLVISGYEATPFILMIRRGNMPDASETMEHPYKCGKLVCIYNHARGMRVIL